MIFEESYTLSNGVKIPKVGLGTWFISDAQAAEAVRQAVRNTHMVVHHGAGCTYFFDRK